LSYEQVAHTRREAEADVEESREVLKLKHAADLADLGEKLDTVRPVCSRMLLI
jgi:hypothetical protein